MTQKDARALLKMAIKRWSRSRTRKDFPNVGYPLLVPTFVEYVAQDEDDSSSTLDEFFQSLEIPEDMFRDRTVLIPVVYPVEGADLHERLTSKDPGFYDHNLHLDKNEFTRWMAAQKEYVISLPVDDQVTLRSYSYSGDKMLHSFLLGTFDKKNLFPGKALDAKEDFKKEHVFPLAVPFLEWVRSLPTIQDFVAGLGLFPTALQQAQSPQDASGSGHQKRQTTAKPSSLASILRYAYRVLKNRDSIGSSTYHIIMYFFFNFDLPDPLYTVLLTLFRDRLQRIILDAPRPNFGFYVYRGIKSADHVVLNPKHVFENRIFTSTSLSIVEAASFATKSTRCCVQQIFVPPGMPCLFMPILSYFYVEMEVLFPLHQKMFSLEKPFRYDNLPFQVQNFVLVP